MWTSTPQFPSQPLLRLRNTALMVQGEMLCPDQHKSSHVYSPKAPPDDGSFQSHSLLEPSQGLLAWKAVGDRIVCEKPVPECEAVTDCCFYFYYCILLILDWCVKYMNVNMQGRKKLSITATSNLLHNLENSLELPFIILLYP